MPSTRLKQRKDGSKFYEISVSRGYGKSAYTTRWDVPPGLGEKTIQRQLTKFAEDFQRRCESGEVLTRQEQKEKEQQEQLAQGQILTLQQYGERVFMPMYQSMIAETTRSSFDANLRNHIYPTLGNYKLPEITSAQITALLLSKRKILSRSTCQKIYIVLKLLFKNAYKTDMIENNPMDKVDPPKAKKGELIDTEAKSFTLDELVYIDECLEKEPLKWRCLVCLLMDTGIRRGECCGLKWENVDLEAGYITIKGNLQYTPAKGVYLDTPKNSKSREIDIDPSVVDLLRELKKEQDKLTPSPFVFSQDNSDKPMHPQSPTRYFKTFEKKYGVEDFHPHKLRHSFASVAITNGADVASVSEKLGHSDKAVTLRMYTHADKESIKRAGNIYRNALRNKKNSGQE